MANCKKIQVVLAYLRLEAVRGNHGMSFAASFFYPAEAVMLRQRVPLHMRNCDLEGIGTFYAFHRADTYDINSLRGRHEGADDIARPRGVNAEPFKRIVMPAVLYSC